MSDTTPTNGHEPDGSPRTPHAASSAGWGSAPTPTSTATLETPAPDHSTPSGPSAQQQPYRADTGAWNPGAPNGATPWYGAAAPTNRRNNAPKPPWFWPILAAIVGLAALLIGGGIGFAIGHEIGGDQSQSTTQVPGTNGGTNQFPGNGTGQAPGYGSGSSDGSGSTDGSDSGTGS
ncbi:hypothetical protein [Curtobacterium sp. VKM Ac-1376]|uniref:hypothetical protein n=1 Tax=Curtobacterium sp. VKM Ac-1376 TaxID=123312 RepID=UPI00188C84D7|nr:hypothetical protein [Curtobacterium sp. VKM Ac-1376]MBF4613179.1 hypothetical protein [Curtobacterium sp. VKM Ac-1376]